MFQRKLKTAPQGLELYGRPPTVTPVRSEHMQSRNQGQKCPATAPSELLCPPPDDLDSIDTTRNLILDGMTPDQLQHLMDQLEIYSPRDRLQHQVVSHRQLNAFSKWIRVRL